MYKALVIFVAGYLTVTSVNSDHWHYAVEGPNGVVNDNEDWGGMCAAGMRQSPVDLAHDASIKGEYPGFIFENYDTPMKTPDIINNGHSIQISTTPGEISVSGGGLPGTYIFDQMHFHWASEHLINNDRYALELHMVHHEKRFESITRAAQEKNGVAVLGILFHVSLEPNMIIENILLNAGNIFEAVGRNQTYKDKLLLDDLLPKRLQSYFRYEGSLTTPGCGEAVVWTVFDQSIPISMDQVERFKAVQDDEGQKLTHNYRHIQPLNSRALVYIQGSTEYSAASFKGASMFLMFVSLVITTLGMKLK
ncbi:CLUMA_CG002626, isoform A [Clunio marinus]|uniref:Carbonic anhydrase n=1 Tax=Clunio marinus TaxID=568069 RepID=A0A1J1HNE5_9DIPT|nr:CLUMA_CG002626, isoform A [Clunio marinus]